MQIWSTSINLSSSSELLYPISVIRWKIIWAKVLSVIELWYHFMELSRRDFSWILACSVYPVSLKQKKVNTKKRHKIWGTFDLTSFRNEEEQKTWVYFVSSGKVWEESVCLWGRYGLKQGNPFANFWYSWIKKEKNLIIYSFHHIIK